MAYTQEQARPLDQAHLAPVAQEVAQEAQEEALGAVLALVEAQVVGLAQEAVQGQETALVTAQVTETGVAQVKVGLLWLMVSWVC